MNQTTLSVGESLSLIDKISLVCVDSLSWAVMQEGWMNEVVVITAGGMSN